MSISLQADSRLKARSSNVRDIVVLSNLGIIVEDSKRPGIVLSAYSSHQAWVGLAVSEPLEGVPLTPCCPAPPHWPRPRLASPVLCDLDLA